MHDIYQLLLNFKVFEFLEKPEFIAFCLTLFLGVLKRLFSPSARVIWGDTHGFTFLIPQRGQDDGRPAAIPNLAVNTKSIFVRNAGRKIAKNIEIYFNYKPEHFEIWPVIKYDTEVLEDNRFVVKIEFLQKKEFFTIEAIHTNNAFPEVQNVRAEVGKCKNVRMAPVQIFSNYFNATVFCLMILGIFQIITFIVSFFV